MNGRDFEPATIMTHYESDYGAACKTHYTLDQEVTVVIPNLVCTRWQAFRGKIVGAPSYPACRSQMEIRIEGPKTRAKWRIPPVAYGNYTRTGLRPEKARRPNRLAMLQRRVKSY
jgi:hypothetical protein